MPGRVEFCLLGPLLVRCDGNAVPVSRGKQRALLAALLLNANQVISLTAIADVLWGPQPPSSADMTIRNYVKRLRRALRDTGPDRISTHPHGYLMRADATELDVRCCAELVSAARAAERSGNWEQASAHAGAALALWRGTPLADIGSETLESGEGAQLAELRLQVLELRIDADLHLGRHAQVILELQRLRQEYPLRERPHALAMLALYRSGRQAEALDVYLRARGTLVTELGLEPSQLLRDLHQRILTADPALGLPSAAPVSSPAAQIVPRELPGAVREFVGREAELAQLTGFVTRTDQLTAPMAVIAGTAGVGKTALALHWAHLMAGNFPDGQLYVDLCGYDFDQPKTATAVLATILSALGVPREGIPAEAAERAARYRSMLAGRRILVVLDNARSVEQVRPVVPATPGCAALVTSRDALAGLVARYGAMRIGLDVLPLPEATQLLRQLIGDRVDAEPGLAETLALQCSRLPLALRIAAELCSARPAVPVSTLVRELADERPLDTLDARQDKSTRVRTVFNWSYRARPATGLLSAFRASGRMRQRVSRR